jgi:hypothetical protein
MHIDSIREAVTRRPFVPFSFRLADGRAIPVQHPEHVAYSRRVVAVVGHQNPTFTFTDPILIVSIDYENATGIDLPRSARPRNDEDEFPPSET